MLKDTTLRQILGQIYPSYPLLDLDGQEQFSMTKLSWLEGLMVDQRVRYSTGIH